METKVRGRRSSCPVDEAAGCPAGNASLCMEKTAYPLFDILLDGALS
jgi:hypothetical protein